MAVSILTSPVLSSIPGLAHGFSTRAGGKSSGPFSSLNLGFSTGDDDDLVEENYGLFAQALSIPPEGIAFSRQVHGKNCVLVTAKTDLDELSVVPADALITRDPGVFVCVRTADCYPILVVDPHERWIAAVHAGWRGTLEGVLRETIQTMKEKLGVVARDLRVAIGPGISLGSFEVSSGVAALFRGSPGLKPSEIVENEASSYIDLEAINARQAVECGVDPANVWKSGCCTVKDAKRFYSYRRDGKQSGRMASVVGWKSA